MQNFSQNVFLDSFSIETILFIISLSFIIPVYLVTINNSFKLKSSNWIKYFFINPFFIFIAIYLEQYLLYKNNIYVDGFTDNLLLIGNIILFYFLFILCKNKNSNGQMIFIYSSLLLVELTMLSLYLEVLTYNHELIINIFYFIITPIIIYFAFYYIIIKRIKFILFELDKQSLFYINMFLILAIILIFMLINIESAVRHQVDIYIIFRDKFILLNYLFLLAELIANYIILNIVQEKYELRKTHDELIKTQEQVISSFAKVIENVSLSTSNHVNRVSEYTKVLSKALGYNDKEVKSLSIAAMLHDVGKVYIPNYILEKEDKLTNEEFDIVKTHVTKGESLLHNIDGELIDLAKLISLQHHEKWNGEGYLGLKGEEISLEARIVAVADVFDALVSKRSYKEGWKPLEAKELILKESGKHFDPQVVKVFDEHFSEILGTYYNFID